ncbi:MAG: sterol desaturase family protein [Caulobacteraceae bacterium]
MAATALANRLGAPPAAFPAQGLGVIGGFLLYFLMMELVEYWFHRAEHIVPWLWSLHSLHHADPEFDSTTAVVHHWLPPVIHAFLVSVPIGLLFKIPAGYVLLYSLLSYHVYLMHANLKLDFGRLSWVVTSPSYHRIHHSTLPEHYNRNYAFILPIFDVVFGSYRPAQPGEWPKVGLGVGEGPRGVIDLICWPIRGVIRSRSRPGGQTSPTHSTASRLRSETWPAVRRAAARRWPEACAVLAGIGLFVFVFGPAIVSDQAPIWRRPPGDMAMMVAGELAAMREPWTFPLLVTHDLTWPAPVSLVYTDSIPWMTVALKAAHLGGVASHLGLFLLLSYALQGLAAVALLRAAGARNPLVLLGGAAFAMTSPAWLMRPLDYHVALTGHVILMLALALTVDSARRGLGRLRLAGFCALAVLAVGVHAYHVVPVTVLFLCAVASQALQQDAANGRKALARAFASLAAFAVSVEAAALVLGYFVGLGVPEAVHNLGRWSMNVLAPIMPQASTLSGQIYEHGAFSHTVDPTGGQAVEGYNYLGAGGLLLLAVAAGRAGWRTLGQGRMPSSAFLRRWGPLAVGLLALTVVAIGPKPYVYTWRGPEMPVPGGILGNLLGEFRSHGRFFWVVSYAVVAAGLLVLDRSWSGRKRVAGAILATGLALQVADVSGLILAVRQNYAEPAPRMYPLALDAPSLRSRPWRIFPTYFHLNTATDKNALRQLAVGIMRGGGVMTSSQTARVPIEALDSAPPADALVDAPRSDRSLTLVLGGPEVTGLFRRRTDCRALEGGLLCGQDLGALPLQVSSLR